MFGRCYLACAVKNDCPNTESIPMPRYFLKHVSHNADIDSVEASVYDERDVNVAHFFYFARTFGRVCDVTTSLAPISNTDDLSDFPLLLPKILMKLFELTTPDTAIPMCPETDEPIVIDL